MSVKLLTENHLEFLSLIGGCTGSSVSRHVKMPDCWNSHFLPSTLTCNLGAQNQMADLIERDEEDA